MADPINMSASILGLATFALTSSTTLYSTVRSFQSQDKQARELKGELGDLTGVLQSLLETVTSNPDIDFEALKPPLHRCGNACKEYGDLIARFTKPSASTSTSTSTRQSVRQWFAVKYLQGDINDFKIMLAGYKSTINIALANANLRVVTITPRVLEDYKEMISDTTHDLKQHLQSIEAKIERLTTENEKPTENNNVDWQAMLEEKRSTQQGLEICAQLTHQIEQLEPTPGEHEQFANYPSAHKYMTNGLNTTRSTVRTLMMQLQKHEDDIDRRMDAMKSTVSLSKDATADLARLQETKESIRQCIKVVCDADDSLVVQRHNLFEDITLAEDASNFTISTVGDLVTARRINLTGRSLNVGGQISDESYQRSIDVIAQRGPNSVQPDAQEFNQTSYVRNQKSTDGEFHGRHGPGVRLSKSTEGGVQRKEVSQLDRS